MIRVQRIQIRWTKATRGAPRAQERAQLPRTFSIAASDAGYSLQHYQMDEDDGFILHHRRHDSDTCPRREGELHLHWLQGRLRLDLHANRGKPQRNCVNRAVQLAPGEFGQLRFNERHASYYGQFYTETIYNVAVGDRVPENRFLGVKPDRELNLMADVF